MATQLGFLGLGSMGSAISTHLLETGHDVLAWNRTPEPAALVVAAGATLADSAAEALAAPISFSMFANDEAAESVLTADAFAGAPGRIHVNMASISAVAADRLEKIATDAGVGYISSPVLGRPSVAATGSLNMLTAGPDDLVERVLPLLEVIGARVWRFGERPRTANAVKISVNFTIVHALQALAEGINLVEAHDIDAGEFVELLGNTLFPGAIYNGYGSMMAHRRYSPPGFTLTLGLKDLGLAEDLAEEGNVTLPSAQVLRERFETALATTELDGLDWASLAEVTRGR